MGPFRPIFNSDNDVAQACKLVDVRNIPVDIRGLHSDTEPEAIAKTQREVIRDYLKTHGFTSVVEISEAVVLPEWTVKRRLKELRVRFKCPNRKQKASKQGNGCFKFRTARTVVA